ncbi:MAG: ABC transporter substrate-binding protein [Bacteroidetes bacterium]|nr:ABC transporter substrate-binding protein [Bacteroidota bacterium]MCL5026803.1 ABC transporter substrate-binding protein [Chloroflexota bacterium]
MRASSYLATALATMLVVLAGCAAPTPSVAPAATSPAVAVTPALAPPTVAPKPSASTPTPAANIKRGGTLKAAEMFAYPTLDPQLSSSSGNMGYDLLFEPLISFVVTQEEPPKYELRPELAESWKLVDPKTVELKLRKGVKFGDGTAWNAEVAKWNLDRIRTHKKSVNKENVDSIASVDVVDDYTIRLNLKAPSAAIFMSLTPSGTTMYMVSKAAVEKSGDDEFGRNPVGTGPMQFVRWTQDDNLELKRRDDYWKMGADGKPLPYIDSFFDYFKPDAAVTIVEMKAGTLDLTMEVDAKDVAGIKANPNLRFIAHPINQAGYFGFGMSPKTDLFQNKNVRLAIQYAVDRASMAKALSFGLGTPHYVRRWAPGVLGYEEGAYTKYEYNPAKAKQYLTDAGYPNGVDITMQVINRAPEIRMAEMAKSMFDNVGIRTTLEVMERVAWVDKMHSLNFQMSSHRPAASPDPDLALRMEGCGAAGNWFGWCNQEFDKCMVEGRSTYDEKQRGEIYKRCINIMIEDAWTGVAYRMPWNFVVNKRVQNFQYGWDGPDLREVWLQ